MIIKEMGGGAIYRPVLNGGWENMLIFQFSFPIL